MTIPIDRHYIPAFSIEDVLLDKDSGEPMAGGKVYFYQDNQRSTLKDVYQITGASPDYNFVPLPNPVILSAIGTFEDTLGNPVIPYFWPFQGTPDNPGDGSAEYYWVRVFNANDVHQFDRESQPYIPDLFTEAVDAQTFNNEIMNPQFTEVLFDTTSAYTITFNPAPVAQVVSIAPGWDLVVSGALNCTVTLTRVAPTGSENIATNPAYVLDINSTNVTALSLRQRIYGAPGLFANEYVATMLLGKSLSGAAETVTVQYIPSNPVQAQTLLTAILPASAVFVVQPTDAPFNVLIDPSSSSQSAPNAYVDINLVLPINKHIQLSSIQVVSTGQLAVTGAVPYDETSAPRQQAFMFDYYQPQINFKPIPSLLTGWDFPLNPRQFNNGTGSIVAVPDYVWDQTIIGRITAGVNYTVSPLTGGLQATTVANNSAFYLLQYMAGAQVKKMIGTRLSANVNAYKGTVGAYVNVRVYMYRALAVSSFPLLSTNVTIGTVAINGVFSLTPAAVLDGWTEIPRSNLGTAFGSLSVLTTNTDLNNPALDLGFNGWEIVDPAHIADTDKYAIVVTFSCPNVNTVVTINSISCVPGDIPTRPAPQTFDEVRRECMANFESSYPNWVAPGTPSNGGLTFYQVGHSDGVNDFFTSTPFGVQYKVPKVSSTPIIKIYSSSLGTLANVDGQISQNGGVSPAADVSLNDNYTLTYSGNTGFSYQPKNSNKLLPNVIVGGAYLAGLINFHFTSDARYGVV